MTKQNAIAVLLCLACVVETRAATGVVIEGVRVDGKIQAVNSNVVLRLAPRPRELVFSFENTAPQGDQPVRLRYRLEGRDQAWADVPSYMRMVVRFLDAGNQIIAATEFGVTRQSPGWRGRVETSEFTPHTGETVAPPRAVRLQLWCVSGGPEMTVGVFAFQDVCVRLTSARGQPVREVCYSTDTGVDLDQSLGAPADWVRDGSRPEMAEVARVTSPQPRHALVLRDTDTRTFAAWLVPPDKCCAVVPGERVRVTWQECFCVGHGGPAQASYAYLPAGNYWFRAAAVGVDGVTVGVEASLPLVVLMPVWQRGWFWALTGGSVMLVALGLVRYTMHRRLQRELDRLKWQQAVERERTRIARDIHDDLGTNLTLIGLLSQVIRRETTDGSRAASAAEEVGQTARAMTQAMAEIVWAVNPNYDTLEGLANYLGRFAQEFLSTAGLRCRLDMPVELPALAVPAETRHELFLAFKEALNNIVRHARATEVRVALTVEPERFSVSVTDDGCGFAAETVADRGNGLTNMAARLKEIGGTCEIVSQPGKGTTVRLSAPGGGNG